MSAYEHLAGVIAFAEQHVCEEDANDCENCENFSRGQCPVYLAKDFLTEEGYEVD